MAFLTKKEQSMLVMASQNNNLSLEDKQSIHQQIKHNAQLRQDNFRPAFKKLFGIITSFKADNILKEIQNG